MHDIIISPGISTS